MKSPETDKKGGGYILFICQLDNVTQARIESAAARFFMVEFPHEKPETIRGWIDDIMNEKVENVIDNDFLRYFEND